MADTTYQQDHPRTIEELHAEALGAQWDREHAVVDPHEGSWAQVKEAESAEKVLALLDDQKSRKWAYRKVALTSSMPHAKFRFLCYLLEVADDKLDNCFRARRTMAKDMCMAVEMVDDHFRWFRKQGWLRSHEFRREDGGESSNGYQFLVPPGVLGPGGNGWEGPTSFSKREGVTRVEGSYA